MRCNDFHDRINQLLDERLKPSQDAAVQQHAEFCKACQRDLQSYQLLTMRGVQTSAKQRRSNSLLTPTFWFTIAATLFIALTFFPRSQQTKITQTNSDVIPAVEHANLTSIKPLVQQVATTISHDHVVANGHFVQPILSIRYMARADWSRVQPVEMPFGVRVPTVEAKWIQVVADEMVPIQQSVNSTLHLIARTLSTSA